MLPGGAAAGEERLQRLRGELYDAIAVEAPDPPRFMGWSSGWNMQRSTS